jgi:hypothetical protein
MSVNGHAQHLLMIDTLDRTNRLASFVSSPGDLGRLYVGREIRELGVELV